MKRGKIVTMFHLAFLLAIYHPTALGAPARRGINLLLDTYLGFGRGLRQNVDSVRKEQFVEEVNGVKMTTTRTERLSKTGQKGESELDSSCGAFDDGVDVDGQQLLTVPGTVSREVCRDLCVAANTGNKVCKAVVYYKSTRDCVFKRVSDDATYEEDADADSWVACSDDMASSPTEAEAPEPAGLDNDKDIKPMKNCTQPVNSTTAASPSDSMGSDLCDDYEGAEEPDAIIPAEEPGEATDPVSDAVGIPSTVNEAPTPGPEEVVTPEPSPDSEPKEGPEPEPGVEIKKPEPEEPEPEPASPKRRPPLPPCPPGTPRDNDYAGDKGYVACSIDDE